MEFTKKDITDFYTSAVLTRARKIRSDKKVKSVQITDDGLIVGLVRGSDGELYEQNIAVYEDNGAFSIDDECSCPVEIECKHSAAVLLELLDRQGFIKAVAFEPLEGSEMASVEQMLRTLQAQASSKAEKLINKSAVQSVQQGINQIEMGRPKTEPLSNEIKTWFGKLEHDTQPEHEDGNFKHTMLFVLDLNTSRNNITSVTLEFVGARLNKSGLGELKPFEFKGRFDNLPAYAQRDSELLRMYMACRDPLGYAPSGALEDAPLTQEFIKKLLETGRCYWSEVKGEAFKLGAVRAAKAIWRVDARGVQRGGFEAEPAATLELPFSPPWFVDTATHELGVLETGISNRVAKTFLSVPALKPELVPAFLSQFDAKYKGTLPAPRVFEERMSDEPCVPIIKLFSNQVKFDWSGLNKNLESLTLEFEYGGVRVMPRDGNRLLVFRDGVLYSSARDERTELNALKSLQAFGFVGISRVVPSYWMSPGRENHLAILGDPKTARDPDWLKFVTDEIPRLNNLGWKVEYDTSFRFNIAQVSEFYGDLEDGAGWFGLELGVIVDGNRVSLIPLLVQLLRDNTATLSSEQLEKLPDNTMFYPKLPDGRLLQLPIARVRAILGVLLELYMGNKLNDGKLRLPMLDAARLAELEKSLELRWFGDKKMLDLGRKLQNFDGIKTVDVPKSLTADLRHYQLQGLSWLQFLRENELGGILADDMGLGKTVQALAHFALEKQEKRAKLPILVIAPTSLMTNWRLESERFTPNLKVLVLHGAGRFDDFARIGEFDLVLTTYPLVLRDLEHLKKHKYHMLVLDEAQNIKNAKSGAAKTIASLKANHRLCLTGTPLENHLGELWSLFHFLMPGFLGDEKSFKEFYRNPIEKKGDNLRRNALATRVKPFLLRRSKALVASELPAKTEIIERLELEGSQRDLYETLRTSMSDKVREEIMKKGLAKSQIMILDALLKLRQACCDPRLLKLEAARKATNSAKLEWLQENLPQMLEEGRKVLIFSQFATLLGLLELELQTMNVPYSKLTGETKDRPHQIDSFQLGENKVFLISLKAGGVGLNLTAADTVIHFDPWWNPAAENQATDRAHRIGQDKPVFVYKLIAEGSLEEKILLLQEKKAELARGILEGGLASSTALTNEDLNFLFAPLGDSSEKNSKN
jgi:superfamily II DNA or RNA helicase